MGGLIITVLKDMKVCVPLLILGKMSAERMNEDSINYPSLTICMRDVENLRLHSRSVQRVH